MDFNAGSRLMSDPFQNYLEDDEFGNTFTKRKSYIYVISKVFDNTRYYKVGMSTKSDISRMRDANTYLIPGKENYAYQVHYLFFFDESPFRTSFAQYIEKEIHAVLRHEFDSYSIRFLTNNPSEWYLPQKTNSSNNRRRTRRSQSGEDWFFGYVLGLIAVNQPKPRESYQFTKATRKDITKQVQNPSKQILRQYNQHKRDWRDVMKIVKIEKKMNKRERDERLGDVNFWRDKLIGLEFVDKDDKTKKNKTWVITDVDYESGKYINTYIIGYKIKGKGSVQDMEGYESQIVELLDKEQYPWFTPARLKKLGVYEKYLEWKKKQEGLT